jgi:RNA polymerase sigma-70 factor (ECF subfamily)
VIDRAAERRIERLYREHGHVVLRRARELLRSDAEATDAVQDIFLSLVQRPEQLQGVTKITAWLYRATTHYCLNKLRARRGHDRILGALRPVASVDPRGERLAHVRALLDRLPEPLGEAVIYHHVDGMTYDEIAAMLGCSRRQVGYLLERVHAIASHEPSPAGAALRLEERES